MKDRSIDVQKDESGMSIISYRYIDVQKDESGMSIR